MVSAAWSGCYVRTISYSTGWLEESDFLDQLSFIVVAGKNCPCPCMENEAHLKYLLAAI